MQQLGNMKDNFDDLSDPEQFACLVNARQYVFINIKKKILRLRGICLFSVEYIQYSSLQCKSRLSETCLLKTCIKARR